MQSFKTSKGSRVRQRRNILRSNVQLKNKKKTDNKLKYQGLTRKYVATLQKGSSEYAHLLDEVDDSTNSTHVAHSVAPSTPQIQKTVINETAVRDETANNNTVRDETANNKTANNKTANNNTVRDETASDNIPEGPLVPKKKKFNSVQHHVAIDNWMKAMDARAKKLALDKEHGFISRKIGKAEQAFRDAEEYTSTDPLNLKIYDYDKRCADDCSTRADYNVSLCAPEAAFRPEFQYAIPAYPGFQGGHPNFWVPCTVCNYPIPSHQIPYTITTLDGCYAVHKACEPQIESMCYRQHCPSTYLSHDKIRASRPVNKIIMTATGKSKVYRESLAFFKELRSGQLESDLIISNL